MPKWKDSLNKISGKSEKEREAAFEAAMIAALAKDTKPEPASPPPIAPQAPASSSASITITVTEDGKTTTYPDLASVPLPLRQRIISQWLSAPKP